MFGVVPRPLWEKKAPPDDRNRIQLAMRPLLVEADWGRMLIDCGAGDKMDAKQRDIYALDRTRHLDHALADAGPVGRRDRRRAGDASALRSLRRRDERDAGGCAPRFPQRALPDPRGRVGGRHASARAQPRQLPAGRLRAAEGRRRRRLLRRRPDDPARRARACAPAATPASIRSSSSSPAGKTAVFTADLIPTTAHIAGSVDHGLRPVSDGDAGVQEAVHPRGDRPRIPDLLRARPAGGRRVHPGEGRASATSSRCCRLRAWSPKTTA